MFFSNVALLLSYQEVESISSTIEFGLALVPIMTNGRCNALTSEPGPQKLYIFYLCFL